MIARRLTAGLCAALVLFVAVGTVRSEYTSQPLQPSLPVPTGTPSAGQIIVATSPTASAWTAVGAWFDSVFCNTVGYVVVRTTGGWVCSNAIPINVMWFGAANSAAGSDVTAIQAAIAVQEAKGGCVYTPSGFGYRLTGGLVATADNHAFCIFGDQSGAGPGILSPNISNLIAASTFTDGDILLIRGRYGPTVKNIKFDFETCAPTCNRRSAGGNGLHLSGPISPAASMAYPHIENIVTQWQFFGIYETNVSGGTITDTYHQSYAHSALYNDRTGAVEISFGNIFGINCFGDTVAPVTQIACISTQGGYMKVIGGGMAGGQYGILIDPALSLQAGYISINSVSIEEQSVCGINVQNVNGGELFMLQINNNEFSVVNNSATGNICIQDNGGGGPYITGASASHNIIRNIGNRTAISVANGRGWQINGNNIIVAGGAQTGIATSTADAIAPLTVFDNVFPFSAGTMTPYAFTAAVAGVDQTSLRDLIGFTAGTLPTGTANGSQVFVIDGAPASACTGGSTGSMGFKQNGAYKCF